MKQKMECEKFIATSNNQVLLEAIEYDVHFDLYRAIGFNAMYC